jgi:hypothetical protein
MDVSSLQFYASRLLCRICILTFFLLTAAGFTAEGSISLDAGTVSYTYTPASENLNKRTIEGFSIDAKEKMRSCVDCDYYDDFQKFVDYYGTEFYGDEWITAALTGTKTSFTNGDGDFTTYSLEGRAGEYRKVHVGRTIIVCTWSNMYLSAPLYRDRPEGYRPDEHLHVRYS